MLAKIVSHETMLEERRRLTYDTQIPYIGVDGKPKAVKKKVVAGEMEVFDLAKPVGEMITTPAGLDAIVQKTVIDLELGREQVPLLYGPIYRRMEDPNFTQNVDIQPFTSAQVVFLEKMELEEVKFGTRKVGEKETVPIITYAAGFEWTEDIVLYDKTWEVSEAARAMGEAYNALLNHIHLGPIVQFAFDTANTTAWQGAIGQSFLEGVRATIRKGLVDASQDRHPDTGSVRRPTILLAHSSMRWDIEEALQRMQIGGTIYPAISQINTLIFYDGYSIKVGDILYTYPGVSPEVGYLIDPQRFFRELVKHDLRVDATEADLRRLIEKGIVGRARRGVALWPTDAVQQIALAPPPEEGVGD